ncbi:unnamed protein product [Urochloa humidicola]
MCMFWDLHLTADHMRRDGVAPDLVTHGCFIDAYLERRLARNLTFAFDRLDGIVLEAFGKAARAASRQTSRSCWRPPPGSGRGHTTSCSEELLEATAGKRPWMYYKLLGIYLRKQHRRNQDFWN